MRRKSIAVVLGLLVFAISAAFAASLGGLNAASLGADVTVVASCHTVADGVLEVEFDTTFSNGEYRVDSVTLSTISENCDGKTVEITLTDGTNALDSATAVYDHANDAGTLTLTMAGEPSAEATTGVAVLIAD